ncbi:MAG TPA: hypothetical protein VNF91_10750 [Candidatus Acidoferrum sp.]|nr:hypothetical protein [Candidatus Acidoferrum sp.]
MSVIDRCGCCGEDPHSAAGFIDQEDEHFCASCNAANCGDQPADTGAPCLAIGPDELVARRGKFIDRLAELAGGQCLRHVPGKLLTSLEPFNAPGFIVEARFEAVSPGRGTLWIYAATQADLDAYARPRPEGRWTSQRRR